MKENDFDIITVGGGGAGLAAGIIASQAGARCMVLEADGKLGGATALSAAVMYASATSVQKARGIEDTPEAMFRYIMTLAGWEANPKIMRIMCEQSGPALEWLKTLGVVFPEEYLLCSGVEDVPRGHPSMGLADALINAAGVAGVEYALGTRVDELIIDAGRVVGVRADGADLHAGAVIITTGGFGNNPEMIRELYPTAASHGEKTYAVHFGAPYICGDGITLGRSAGADIVGVDTGLLLPTSGLGRFVEAFLPPWALIVNVEGKRFMDESAPYAVSGYLMNSQPEQRGFAIFDDHALEVASQDMRFADPYHSGAAMPTWEYGLLKQSVANGKIIKADSIAELANKISVDGQSLGNTIERYNSDCDRGCDGEFSRRWKRAFQCVMARTTPERFVPA